MVACNAGVSWCPKVKPAGSTAILELQRVVGTAPGLGCLFSDSRWRLEHTKNYSALSRPKIRLQCRLAVWSTCNQSLGIHMTMAWRPCWCTIAKGANGIPFVNVHQQGGDDVTCILSIE